MWLLHVLCVRKRYISPCGFPQQSPHLRVSLFRPGVKRSIRPPLSSSTKKIWYSNYKRLYTVIGLTLSFLPDRDVSKTENTKSFRRSFAMPAHKSCLPKFGAMVVPTFKVFTNTSALCRKAISSINPALAHLCCSLRRCTPLVGQKAAQKKRRNSAPPPQTAET